MPYFQVVVVAFFVGAYYALLGVKSPAPPLVAIIGLAGMLATSLILPPPS